MDIRRLQAFCKVYELRSFSRAGEDLFLSQPTVSANIMALEEELDTRLFDRLGRTVMPTPAGDVLYRHATRVFDILDNAKADVLALKERVAGDLVLGASTIPAHYLAPRLLAAFRRSFPEVTIDLVVGDSRDITDRVLDGGAHLGLVGAPCDHPDLECEPFLEDHMVIVAPASLPPVIFPQNDPPAFRRQLAALPFVMREHGSGTRMAFERALRCMDLDPRELTTSIVVHSTQAVLECVKAGLGVSPTSRLAAEDLLASGAVRVLDIPELTMCRSFFRVHHKRRFIFPAMRRFIEHLRPRD